MTNTKACKHCLIAFFTILLIIISTSQLSAGNTPNPALARTTPLELKHKQLKQDTSALLKRLIAERAKVLEEMRKQARADMAEWENDPNYLNGQGLKAALLTSEAVAEGYGFDVPKLREMYQVTKKSILGLEMVTKCGKS